MLKMLKVLQWLLHISNDNRSSYQNKYQSVVCPKKAIKQQNMKEHHILFLFS